MIGRFVGRLFGLDGLMLAWLFCYCVGLLHAKTSMSWKPKQQSIGSQDSNVLEAKTAMFWKPRQQCPGSPDSNVQQALLSGLVGWLVGG